MANMSLRDMRAIATVLYDNCPIHNKTAFDNVWLPIVQQISHAAIPVNRTKAFENAARRGFWNKDLHE